MTINQYFYKLNLACVRCLLLNESRYLVLPLLLITVNLMADEAFGPKTNRSTSDGGNVYSQLCELRTNLLSWARTHPGSPYEGRPIPAALKTAELALDAIDPGIKFRLAFSRQIFFVSSAHPGDSYGCATNRVFMQQGTERYSDGLAWVLPISNFESIVIISAVGPKQTTILAFDDHRKFRLVYDSFRKPNAALRDSPSGLDYLCGIQVAGRNRFLLHEGRLRGMSQASLFPRTFLLSTTNNGDICISPTR